MPDEKKTTDQLIESLYGFVKVEFKTVNSKLDSLDTRLVNVETKINSIDDRLERVETKVENNNENRLSRLEDSMRVVKTKLGFN